MFDSKIVFEFCNVDKSFGFIDVLYDISFKVGQGEVLCLFGDNGVGKLIFIKILVGVYVLICGEIVMDGEVIIFKGFWDVQL